MPTAYLPEQLQAIQKQTGGDKENNKQELIEDLTPDFSTPAQ